MVLNTSWELKVEFLWNFRIYTETPGVFWVLRWCRDTQIDRNGFEHICSGYLLVYLSGGQNKGGAMEPNLAIVSCNSTTSDRRRPHKPWLFFLLPLEVKNERTNEIGWRRSAWSADRPKETWTWQWTIKWSRFIANQLDSGIGLIHTAVYNFADTPCRPTIEVNRSNVVT